MQIILGSQSPRRKEILELFSLPFKTVVSGFDEDLVVFEGDPVAFANEISSKKAQALRSQFPNHVILTADTVVYKDGKNFGKPLTMQAAHEMLKELSGHTHQVFTSVCVAYQSHLFVEAEKTDVEIQQLSEQQIHTYHNYYNPLDKAGSYAIQKAGSLIVKRIKGCYYNVMGLPLQTTHRLLLKVGIDLWNYLK